VLRGSRRDVPGSIQLDLRSQTFLGSDAFIEQHIPEGSREFREIPREQRLIDRPPLQDIFAAASQDEALVSAYRWHGYRLNEIASFLGVHYSTVSRRLRRLEALKDLRS
jgi:DNA-directed RNA polymerase specialized sigma24 family protein